jgi:hypothetical protein
LLLVGAVPQIERFAVAIEVFFVVARMSPHALPPSGVEAARQMERTGNLITSSTASSSFCRNGSPYLTPIIWP